MAVSATHIDVGTTVGKYTLVDRVGQGGMAVVYRARDGELDREVAVKVLHQHLSESREAHDRFAREARAVAKLRHPNIVEIYDFAGTQPSVAGLSYIVTEFIEGVTLREFLPQLPRDLPEVAATIALQVARAVAHAHEHKVLHRDIKPENVMLRHDGEVKLMDFGISHMVDLERLTVTGQLLGSPAYMAPEHVDGKPIDYRTDVFALGIVLYQLCTGELPFAGKNAHEVLKRIADGKYPPPQQHNHAINNELARIIVKAMARVPADRFQTMAEFAEALQLFLAHAGLETPQLDLAAFVRKPQAERDRLTSQIADGWAHYGKQQLSRNQAAALDAFDRALHCRPQHPVVLACRAQWQRQRQLRHLGLGALGLAAVSSLTLGGVRWWQQHRRRSEMTPPMQAVVTAAALRTAPPADRVAATTSRSPDPPQTVGWPVLRVPVPPLPSAIRPAILPSPAINADRTSPPAPRDSGLVASPSRPAGQSVTRSRATPTQTGTSMRVSATTRSSNAGSHNNDDARTTTPEPLRIATIAFSPKNSEYAIGDGPWQRSAQGTALVDVSAGPQRLVVRNDACCEAQSRMILPSERGTTLAIALPFLPAQVTATCSTTRVVRINGKPAQLGVPTILPFGHTTQIAKQVIVEFIGDEIITKTVTVHPAKETAVTCE